MNISGFVYPEHNVMDQTWIDKTKKYIFVDPSPEDRKKIIHHWTQAGYRPPFYRAGQLCIYICGGHLNLTHTLGKWTQFHLKVKKITYNGKSDLKLQYVSCSV